MTISTYIHNRARPTRTLAMLVALAAVWSTAVGCHGGEDENTPPPVVTVQAATVTQGPIEHWVEGQALIYPIHQADLTPKISAPVSQFLVNRGSVVHAGEVVAELENKDLKAAADEAASEYKKAQADYQTAIGSAIPAELLKARQDETAAEQAYQNQLQIYTARQNLYAQGAIPKRDRDQAAVDLTNAQNAYQEARQHAQALEQGGNQQAIRAAEAELAAAQARAEAAQADLSYTEITSPINGVVTDRPLHIGDLATPSSPLMTIMDLSQVIAKAHLAADQAALLRVGDRATLTAAGKPPVEAHVTVVSAATDPDSTTVEVWAQTPNPDQRLRPGTSVQVAYLAATIPNALTVPAEAVLTDPSGASSVMVIGSDSKAHETDVEVGIRNADKVQIVKGLSAGQRVVTVGAYGLADQTQVKVVNPQP